ncbi:hypothetical protein H072_7325 [Dactylellina haptotyla CBS 200.50]|uniref:Uncharacterized protein n=1 Tax=Dactylellina haptotyla (strain CBS 200.50) TaxID=1284197 RepID=S8A7H4_DACHA|nr:hypothetical protein H072_7325 [Dactylellina haptotyla CBS 200.50]
MASSSPPPIYTPRRARNPPRQRLISYNDTSSLTSSYLPCQPPSEAEVYPTDQYDQYNSSTRTPPPPPPPPPPYSSILLLVHPDDADDNINPADIPMMTRIRLYVTETINEGIRATVSSPASHWLILCLLIANTLLFMLLVYNVEESGAVMVDGYATGAFGPADTAATTTTTGGGGYSVGERLRGRTGGVCRCPLGGGVQDVCFGVFEMIRRAGEQGVDAMGGMGEKGWIGGYEEYEKLRKWEMCVMEVRKVKEWREWVVWMVLPVQCILEMVAAWVWWLCLVEEEREVQTLQRRLEEEEWERERGLEKMEVGEF